MIALVDLRAQYRSIKPEIDAAVLEVLESGQFVLGPQVAAFEQEFAAFCRARAAVGVNTGTSALHLALLAAGVGPGDEVITTAFTFVATAAAVRYTGARPVFVDIDPVTYTIDVMQIERAITRRTRAILPVHLYGQPADMGPIMEIARRHGLAVIEDACQAHGAEYHGQRVGTIGDFGCFSFYPGKNLGAIGEGGAVVTDSAAHERTLRMLRDWGAERKYHHVLQGFNYRLEEIQAAVLRVKLRHLERWTDARRSAAARYSALLRGGPVQTPQETPGVRHVYHIYAIRAHNRGGLQAALQERGIQTGIHYPVPVHLQPAHADLGYRPGDFPHTERAAAEVLSLPMYAELSAAQISETAQAVLACAEEGQISVGAGGPVGALARGA
ncbi:MAG: DegT/DnrJ/EryC1/StrS family aminotransferase [Chloroflexota bacterium]